MKTSMGQTEVIYSMTQYTEFMSMCFYLWPQECNTLLHQCPKVSHMSNIMTAGLANFNIRK